MFSLEKFLLHLSVEKEEKNCTGDLGGEHISCDLKYS